MQVHKVKDMHKKQAHPARSECRPQKVSATVESTGEEIVKNDDDDHIDVFPEPVPWEPRSAAIANRTSREIGLRFDGMTYVILDCTPGFELLFGPVVKGTTFRDMVIRPTCLFSSFQHHVNCFVNSTSPLFLNQEMCVFGRTPPGSSGTKIEADCDIEFCEAQRTEEDDCYAHVRVIARVRLSNVRAIYQRPTC
eukprot:gnl/TRDRNA2_/TRDRNA2_89088_c0_seq2.p1 gnl/TRDRNA2_/TRDRNA2_89088_c0~~gnl/TRDRNA2_/TRDRNA2_89088_c0_seq2.p1  ORF type:complete len:194 (-),score=23.00 gnl/TRDRNA2_/TRDRNA2_89088_c0_seq2:131-712(-)